MKFRLLALALAALASPVFATTTASVTTGTLGITLKDLNAGDGIAAALNWDSSWYLYSGANHAQQTGYQLMHYSWGDSLESRFGPSIGESDAAGSPATSLSGSVVNGQGSYSISLDANAMPSTSVQVSVGEGSTASIWAQFSRSFTLAAGTQVSFSVLADRNLTGTAYTGSWVPPAGLNGYPSHSWASGSLGMNVGSQSAYSDLYGSNGFSYSPEAYETVGEEDQLKLIIRNNTATDQTYWFNFYAQVNVTDQLDPATAAMVPEPGSYALMALGLGCIGIAARRRRRG